MVVRRHVLEPVAERLEAPLELPDVGAILRVRPEIAPGGDVAGEQDDGMRPVEGVEDLAGLHHGAHLGHHRDDAARQAG